MSGRPINRVVGICRPIVDINVQVPRATAEDVLSLANLPVGVTFADDGAVDRVRGLLKEELSAVETIAPGGPVSNALHSLATRLGEYPRPISVVWAGAGSPQIDDRTDNPLVSLRRVGIRTLTSTDVRVRPASSLCIVDSEEGETVAIIVGSREGLGPLPEIGAGDLVLCQMADLPHVLKADTAGSASYALMTADIDRLSQDMQAAIRRIAAEGRLRFVVGRHSELASLEVVHSETVAETYRGVEVVATDGSMPVKIFEPDGPIHLLPVLSGHPTTAGTFLGAGDAYTGAYVGSRVLGDTATEAHVRATDEARLTSYESVARSSYSVNLSALFGRFIDRTSVGADWDYYALVRETSGLTVISCGNVGVDEAALRAASQWGLAGFAVMPEGRRRDGARFDIDGIRIIELKSSSYRFCTWANVYLADGTLLLDVAGGEGSAETRRAAAVLGRPLLEISRDDLLDPPDFARRLRAWADAEGVRVVNVAGSRSVPRDVEAERLVGVALRSLAGRFQNVLRVPVTGSPAGARSTLGIPALLEVRRAVAEVVGEVVPVDRLSWSLADVDVICGKSVDLVRAVADGRIDAALVGSDIVLEEGRENLVDVLDVGLFNCTVALIVPHSATGTVASIAAQYPRIALARTTSPVTNVVAISGSAEGWVASGKFDGAVDTWRTGATASRHGLVLREEIARTTLRLICTESSLSSAAVARARDIAARLVFV